jgi:putative transposase
MSISLSIKPNEFFVRDGSIFRYAMELPLERLLFMPVEADSGSEFTCSEEQFEKMLGRGEITKYEVIRDAEGNIIREADSLDLAPNKQDSKKERDARSLFFFLKKWHSEPNSKYHTALDRFVLRYRAEARRLGHTWLPSAGALHRHLNKYPNIEELTARFVISKTGEVKRARWHPGVAKLLEDIVNFYWEAGTAGRNHIDAYAEFNERFMLLARELATDTALLVPLKKPSEETVRCYINSSECYETVARKFGTKRADDQFTGNYHPVPASRLLEVVLIDSTVMDAWCVLDDETGLPLGRPTLTIAIDLFTRMILAVIITFEPPNLFTAMACLKRVNVEKSDINIRWPNILRKSDGFGKPSMIVVDNELAQSEKSYQSACEDAKINVRWAPVARPQYKAVVERVFLTIKKLILDKLQGGLPFKPEIMRQLGIDPKEIATVHLEKLTELVNMAINDVYHYRRHATLGMPPALAWEKSKKKHKRAFIGDVDFLEKAFGVQRDGVLTTSGIQFENMIFHDPQITGSLLDDLGKTAPRRKRRKSMFSSLNPRVMFKFNPANVEVIHVWNSVKKKYISLPNQSGKAVSGLSLWHWRILRIWAKQESIAFSSPEEQLAARVRLRESIEESIPSEAYKTIKHQRRLLHEPSKLVEGSTIVMTQAPPTAAGMAPDDYEMEVAAHAPKGSRITPPGPRRGGKKSKTLSRRTQQRMNEAARSEHRKPEEEPTVKKNNIISMFEKHLKAASKQGASD